MEELLHIPIPEQPKAEHQREGMTMRVLVSSYPPLGQVTEIFYGKATFTVVLEIEHTRAAEPWEVSLWYTVAGGEQWQEQRLEASPQLKIENIQKLDTNLHHLYFTASLDIESVANFTIKFRPSPEHAWKWIRDHQGLLDGTVYLKNTDHVDPAGNLDELDAIIQDLNPSISGKKVLSQSPNTKVWSLTAPIDAAHGEASQFSLIKFGKPWHGNIERWFAVIRLWYPWIAPRQGRSHFELDKEAIVCSFLEKKGGRHLVLLAVSGVDNVLTVFRSDEHGNVTLDIRNDEVKPGVARIVVALGTTFDVAIAAAMYHARTIVAGEETMSEGMKKELQTLTDEVNPQWQQNWFDGLTYCTWNGLGQRLTEEKILKAVDDLAAANVKITNLIIDDNWQSIDYKGPAQFAYGWIEFEAERKAFPKGLKHTVSIIRERHSNIQHIAVWHALLGYWGGLSKDGELAKKYKTTEVMRASYLRRNLPMGGEMTVVAKEDVFKFYDDFYRFLSSAGIDAVKTDAQFCIDSFESAKHRRDLITTYLDAWNISSLRHFSTKAISCMSQAPQIMFHSQLPNNKPKILVRNSDDFFPDVESSHPWHIFTNANNSLFTEHLNIIPDWDMFQTVHDYSGFHAAARCVSGGPIYITDVPGKHDVDLIKQMTAETVRGKTVILRPDFVGKSLDPYTGYNDEVLLKVGTYHGPAKTGASIMGIFNVSQRPLYELLHLSKFRGVVDPSSPTNSNTYRYIIRSHTGTVSPPLSPLDPHALIHISLPKRGYGILTAYPVTSVASSIASSGGGGKAEGDGKVHIAPLGLIDKFSGAAALLSSATTIAPSPPLQPVRANLDIRLKALGVLGIYISDLTTRGVEVQDRILVTLAEQVVPLQTVTVGERGGGCVVEVDLQLAWKILSEGGLVKPGWGDEVGVRVAVFV